jgi:hypothetical protein
VPEEKLTESRAGGWVPAAVLLRWWDRANAARHGFLLFVGLLVICGITALIGIAPTLIYGQDAFLFLENGWRVAWGLRPQIDFYSGWGPVMFLAEALGLKLTHNSVNAVGVANAACGMVAGVWVYWIGRNRLGSAARLLAALYAALLICAPYPLGTRPWRSAHAMIYNRYGYALLLLILIERFGRERLAETSSRDRLAAFSTGVALAFSMFLKVSFFLAAAPLVVLSFFLGGNHLPKRGKVAGLTAGFAAAALVFLAYLSFDVPSILSSWRSAAGARSIRVLQLSPAEILLSHRFDLVLLIAGICAAWWGRSAVPWRSKFTLPAIAVVMFAADMPLSLTTTAQFYALPLLAIFGLLLADRLAEARVLSATSGNRSRQALALAFCGLLFLYHFGSEAAGTAVAAVRKINPTLWATPARFADAHLAPYLLYELGDAYLGSGNGSVYVNQIDDGIRLLRNHCRPSDRIQTIEMQNPFPFALGWRPPRGGIASTGFDYTVSAKFRPSFDAYFGDATAVMVPKHPATPPDIIGGFNAIYLPALHERYRLAAESPQWWLYKLK